MGSRKTFYSSLYKNRKEILTIINSQGATFQLPSSFPFSVVYKLMYDPQNHRFWQNQNGIKEKKEMTIQTSHITRYKKKYKF